MPVKAEVVGVAVDAGSFCGCSKGAIEALRLVLMTGGASDDEGLRLD